MLIRVKELINKEAFRWLKHRRIQYGSVIESRVTQIDVLSFERALFVKGRNTGWTCVQVELREKMITILSVSRIDDHLYENKGASDFGSSSLSPLSSSSNNGVSILERDFFAILQKHHGWLVLVFLELSCLFSANGDAPILISFPFSVLDGLHRI
ncbi:hypothetical protein BDF20DRAFT_835413 [Mycotypha africana]|uniref:uncharacterized protein n=1 Tax=Mycotypha africana TaxID=64632 RepID=UPI0023010DED|nr:uncharacterized protein BDF20DRAFT_835413 [Mycotypha africana]KAI8979384.1 hypothetical protein BDF20DRAFT_835413 [Mycotypha africana]